MYSDYKIRVCGKDSIPLQKKNKENVGSFYKLFKKDCQFFHSKETEPSQNSLILLFFKSRIVDR